jgi:hypothetical protein
LRRQGWRLIYDPNAIVDHYVAPKMNERQRDDVSLEYVRDSAHNETYALLKWLPTWQRPVALLYELAVGSRMAPGLAAALDRWIRGVRRERIRADLGAALAGRRIAVRSHLISGRDLSDGAPRS